MYWFTNSTDSKEKKVNPFEKKQEEPRRKALAPCPKCKSWNTSVENGIFFCEDCGFEGG